MKTRSLGGGKLEQIFSKRNINRLFLKNDNKDESKRDRDVDG